jgi:predicted branched-subunit amino acid permease
MEMTERPVIGDHAPSDAGGGTTSEVAAFAAGARAALPLSVPICLLGISFGLLARSAGLSPLAAVVMSATTFSGSAQFAAVSVLGAGGTVGAAAGAAALLNARYLAIGLSLAPALRGGRWRRVLLAQLAVDESWAVSQLLEAGRAGPPSIVAGGDATAGRRHLPGSALAGAGVVLLVAHVASTALGAAGLVSLGDPGPWGLDAAFPALFAVLLAPHLRQRRGLLAAILGAAAALALTPFLPPGLPILAAAGAALVGLAPGSCRCQPPPGARASENGA